ELGAAAGLAAAQKLASRGDIPARAQFVAVVSEHGLLDETAQSPAVLETVDARVDELLRGLAVRGEERQAEPHPKETRATDRADRRPADAAREPGRRAARDQSLRGAGVLALGRGGEGGRPADRGRQEGARRAPARAAPEARREAAREARSRLSRPG